MSASNYRLGEKVRHLFTNFGETQLSIGAAALMALAWLLSFWLFLVLWQGHWLAGATAFALHAYFVLRFSRFAARSLRIPEEVILALMAVMVGTHWLLHAQGFYHATDLQLTVAGSVIRLSMLPGFLVAVAITFFTALIVQNTSGRPWSLLWFVLLAVVANTAILPGARYSLLLFQIVLIFSLLAKTGWLDDLSRTECWLYWALSLVLFQLTLFASPLPEFFESYQSGALVPFLLPSYLYLLLKGYLLVIIIKLPLVIVYNHAGLARKLSISSFLQSTFPQVIHIMILVGILYVFTSIWQAETLRQTLEGQLPVTTSEWNHEGLQPFVAHHDSSANAFALIDDRVLKYEPPLPASGIVAIPPEVSDLDDTSMYYYFRSDGSAQPDSVLLLPLDEGFIGALIEQTTVLAGTGVVGYPSGLSGWQSFVLNHKLLAQSTPSKVSPLSLHPQAPPNAVGRRISADASSEFSAAGTDIADRPSTEAFVVGRLFVPLYNTSMQPYSYFAFDILLNPALLSGVPPFFRYLGLFVLFYFLVTLGVTRRVTGFGSQINSKVIAKFNSLTAGIREISSGNLDYKIAVEGTDEFVEVAEHFNLMGEKLKQTIEEVREKERLEQELSIAREVQLSLLPRHLPVVPGYRIAAILKTATEVGGDFYDMIPIGNDKYIFTIGDVSGKSTSAAFYMAQCVSLIRYSPKFTDEPREITLRLNDYFANPTVDSQIFVTAIVGMLDARNGRIRLVRAGHTLPVLIPGKKREKIRELHPPGLGIGLAKSGMMLEKVMKVEEISFSSNDMVVFYTDGVVEAARAITTAGNNGGDDDGDKEFYGEERLLTLLEKNRGDTAAQVMQNLIGDIETFYGGEPPVDDYTLLIIQKTRA